MIGFNKNYIYIICAAFFWGTMGVFYNILYKVGLDKMQIVTVRLTLSAIIFCIYIFLKDKKTFRIHLKDIWCFVGTGIISLFFMTFFYFSAISMTNVSVAAILLYTAPAFVMVFSAVFFKEKITKRKFIALLLTLSGCVLVSGITVISGGNMNVLGIAFGVMSGVSYSLYSIFSRFAINKGYSSSSITLHTFIFASVFSLPFSDFHNNMEIFANPMCIIGCLGISIICCILPYILYTKGMEGVENSKASILATVEPAVATIIGTTIYNDPMDLFKVTGIALIFISIAILGKETD